MQVSSMSDVLAGARFVERRLATAGWLALASLICVALDTVHLGRASLWSDEIFSRYYYEVFGTRFMFGEGLQVEPTPPTYYLLLQAWMLLFGSSEAALRSLSVASDAAAVPLVFLLAREIGGRRAAVAATLLFALCPTGLYFAQEARVYAMTLPATALVLFALATYLRNPSSRFAAVAYVFGATLCLYLHTTLLFMVAACALVVALTLLARGGTASRSAVVRWVALNIAVLLLALPYLVHVLGASQSGGLDWISPLQFRDVVNSVAAVSAGMLTPFPWPSAPVAALFLLALAASLLVHRPTVNAAAVLVFIAGVFLAELILVSLFRPILLPRVLCWTIVPLCVLTGRQLVCAGPLRFVVAVGALLAFGGGLIAYETARNGNKEPWRDVFAQLGPDLQQADTIVLSPHFDPMILRYYAPTMVRSARMWDEQLRPTVMTTAAQRMQVPSISRQQIIGDIAAGKVIWVMSNAVDFSYLNLLNDNQTAEQTLSWNCGTAPCIKAERYAAMK